MYSDTVHITTTTTAAAVAATTATTTTTTTSNNNSNNNLESSAGNLVIPTQTSMASTKHQQIVLRQWSPTSQLWNCQSSDDHQEIISFVGVCV